MAISVRKQNDPLLYAVVAQLNLLRKQDATTATKFHADVTSNGTTMTGGDFRTLTASAALITSPNATDTPTSVTLANEMQTKICAHLADAVAHSAADTTNRPALLATPVGVDDPTVQTLASAIKLAWNAHGTQATVHYNNDAATDSTVISSAATARTSLNAIKALYNTHIASAPLGSSIILIAP